MKLICNFKKFKEHRRDIEPLFQTLIAEELYNSMQFYGEMPDDALTAGKDGIATIVLENEEDIDTLLKYKLDIFLGGIPEIVNSYTLRTSKAKAYCIMFLYSNEFVTLVYVTQHVINNIKSSNRRLALQKIVEDAQHIETCPELMNSMYFRRYLEEFEGYRR